MSTKGKEEPSSAPPPDHWYPLTLGSSFKDQQRPSSNRFCTLRYEFKPASIDKTQPGTLHMDKEKRVTVEFQNNQPGKPKVSFEGSSEDYKENDAVLFFDGQTFRLERLHRSVKRLRYVRQRGESAAAAIGSLGATAAADTNSPPVGKTAKAQNSGRSTFSNPIQVEVEKIDVGNSSNSGAPRPEPERVTEAPSFQPVTSLASPEPTNDDLDDQLDIVDDDDNFSGSGIGGRENFPPQRESSYAEMGIDINMPHQTDMDDDIADVDVNDDEMDTGRNAAEALRAQVNAEGRGEEEAEQSSSSSESSGSENSGSSSGSGSGSGSSSSNNSDTSDADTVDSI